MVTQKLNLPKLLLSILLFRLPLHCVFGENCNRDLPLNRHRITIAGFKNSVPFFYSKNPLSADQYRNSMYLNMKYIKSTQEILNLDNDALPRLAVTYC
jgi:hypothetical protein